MKTVRVRVLRSHVLGYGRIAEVGDILDLPETVAVERITSGAVTPAPLEAAPAPPAAAPAAPPATPAAAGPDDTAPPPPPAAGPDDTAPPASPKPPAPASRAGRGRS